MANVLLVLVCIYIYICVGYNSSWVVARVSRMHARVCTRDPHDYYNGCAHIVGYSFGCGYVFICFVMVSCLFMVMFVFNDMCYKMRNA